MSERPRCRLPVAPGSLTAGDRELTGDDHHYLFRVRRLAVGDRVELFDGAGLRAAATVVEVSKQRARLAVGAPEPAPVEAPVAITALVALIKGDRMDWCVQKLAELGVARIVPVAAARCVVKLRGDRADSRRDRLQAIAADAARQSGRVVVPEIAPVAGFAEAVAAAEGEPRLLLWEGEGRRGLRDAVAGAAGRAPVFAVGPEGGLTDEEVAAARAAGFEPVALGPRILRAETAALAAAAALQWSLGDLGQAI